MPRIVLLVTSPRLPAGLLTATAWDVVRAAPVLVAEESELTTALRSAGAEVRVLDGPPVPALLDAVAAHDTVVWLAARPVTSRWPGSWGCGWPASQGWRSWS